MALGSTIYKLTLQVSNLNHDYYQTHALTVAQHPSETALRMMVRILAFALNAHERLQFTRGLSTDEVPDLWQKNLTGDITQWIEIGQPSLKRLKKACNQSERVCVYTFSGHAAEIWWRQNQSDLTRLEKLSVVNLPAQQASALTALLARSMSLQCTLQDDLIWIGDQHNTVELTPHVWHDSHP